MAIGGVAVAQDRVTSSWLGAQNGSFTDDLMWSNGVPNNSPQSVYDAVISASGNPYTVLLEFERFSSEYFVQSMTLGSAGGILELKDRFYSGGMFIEESFTLPAGKLVLKNATLSGMYPNTRMDIGSGASFEFLTNGSSQHVNVLKNFDVYGGDLEIVNSADLNITGTRVLEGALVLRSFGSAGRNLITESTIDYDIRFDNSSDRRYELMTHVDGLEISEGVTISGRDFWLTPVFSGFPDFNPASFVNRGVIRVEGGESRISYTQNLGVVEVTGGSLNWRGDNEGTLRANGGAELFTYVSNNGGDFRFHNSGLIEVTGEGSRFEILGSFITGNDVDGTYWSNSGTLRVIDHARARLGTLNLNDLGRFESDPTARIEITGQIDLDGLTADASTFNGDAWLTYSNPGGSGGIRGELRNGRVDPSGDWLKFSQDYGYLSDVEIVGGPLVIAGDSSPVANPLVILDNVTVQTGGIVLGANGHVGFGAQVPDVDPQYYNSSISTTHSGGPQSVVHYNGGDLHLGPLAYVSGNLDFGQTAYVSLRIINEGQIVTTMTSGRLDVLSTLDNHGTVSSTQSSRMTIRQLNNFGTLVLDDAMLTGWSVENSSLVDLVGIGQLDLSGVFEMESDSQIDLDAQRFRASVVASVGVIFGGSMNLDLSAIDAPGTYLLFDSKSYEGGFDSIQVTGLAAGLEFMGFDSSSGQFTVDSCPADLTLDGELNFFDVSFFLGAYGVGDAVADFNEDGVFNFFDVSAFIEAYIAGCP